MSAHSQFIAAERRRAASTMLFVLAAAILFAADLVVGTSSISIFDAVSVLFEGPDAASAEGVIIWQLRMPTTLTAFAAGAALSLAGLVIQTITSNPLASPSTLGMTSGASFGAALAVSFGTVFGGGWAAAVGLGFFFAMLISAGILLLAKIRGMTPATIILAGIMLNFLFVALQQLLQYSASAEAAQMIAGWTFGNLERSTYLSAAAAAAALAASAAYFIPNAWSLTLLSLGEDRAASLGVDSRTLRRMSFLFSSVLIASAVSFIGTVSFIGLVAPHLAKLVVGDDARFAMPASIFAGGALLLAASIISKLFSTGALLPVGIVTSLIGVPFLFILLMRERGRV